ncbi:hypothetical protein [Thiomicrospira microaerophila]|nr:hypothetical protein [Thiomicrospira microaerophila]
MGHCEEHSDAANEVSAKPEYLKGVLSLSEIATAFGLAMTGIF